MLSAGLLSVALLVNAFHRSGYRVLLCFIVIFMAVGHYVLFSLADGYVYFGTASIASLIAIFAASTFSSSPLSIDIQILNLVAIGAHMFGYYLYWSYSDPYLYDNIMVFLITIEFIRLMLRTNRDRIHDALEDNSRNDDVYSNASGSGMADQGRNK